MMDRDSCCRAEQFFSGRIVITSLPNETECPLVSIGLVLNAGEPSEVREIARWLRDTLEESLRHDLPGFTWALPIIYRHDFPAERPQDPLSLLEFGSDLKIEYGLDFVLAITSEPLLARFDQSVNGVPSVMLETGVLSIARQLDQGTPRYVRRSVLGLCRHVLGHLFGLDHSEDTVMRPREFWNAAEPLDWSIKEKKEIAAMLQEIADPRLEETAEAARSPLRFHAQVLVREGASLAREILTFRSWMMILHLGRFTAATAVSIIFLFLSAEAWEMGAAIGSRWLDLISFLILILATLSLYFGQNLQAVGRADRMMEQAVRSRIILFGTLFVGLASFWINLFLISLGVIYLLPDSVLISWSGLAGKALPMAHFAKIMATFGILASSLGGNLEEEHDLKAVLVYTEET
jgi:hypothetical protein